MDERAAAGPPVDVSDAYHRWDELFRVGLAMALSGTDEPCETRLARLARGFERSFAERDAALERAALALRGGPRDG